MSLAPGAPSGPPEFEAYRLIQHGKAASCRDLDQRLRGQDVDEPMNLEETARTLYEGAAKACLAALEGKDLWAEAEEARDVVATDEEGLNCLDTAVFDLLDRLVKAHQDDPDAVFELRTGEGEARPPPCPTIEAIDPDHGPPGTQVRLSGSNLDRVTSIEVRYDEGDDQQFCGTCEEDIQRDGKSILVTIAPNEDSARVACIQLFTTLENWVVAATSFVVEPARSTPSPSATTTGSPSPTDFECPPDGS